MTKSDATRFLTAILDGLISEDLASHLQYYCSAEFIGHYKGQEFHFHEMFKQLQSILPYIEKLHFEIEDLVVVDNLIASVTFLAWINAQDKSYHEAILNIILRLKDNKALEFWLMVDQKITAPNQSNSDFSQAMKHFEVNEKDKAEFLRRLATQQHFHQDHHQLTETEKECLFYYLNGFSSKEAAKMLGLTYRTVETYLANIKAKYNCTTKNELRKKLFPHENT